MAFNNGIIVQAALLRNFDMTTRVTFPISYTTYCYPVCCVVMSEGEYFFWGLKGYNESYIEFTARQNNGGQITNRPYVTYFVIGY